MSTKKGKCKDVEAFLNRRRASSSQVMRADAQHYMAALPKGWMATTPAWSLRR